MSHTIKEKKELLTRIRKIKGQAEGIEKALNEEKECSALLQQIAAIRGAVNGLMHTVLEDYIKEHLSADAPADQRNADMEELIKVLRSYLK